MSQRVPNQPNVSIRIPQRKIGSLAYVQTCLLSSGRRGMFECLERPRCSSRRGGYHLHVRLRVAFRSYVCGSVLQIVYCINMAAKQALETPSKFNALHTHVLRSSYLLSSAKIWENLRRWFEEVTCLRVAFLFSRDYYTTICEWVGLSGIYLLLLLFLFGIERCDNLSRCIILYRTNT